MLATSLLLLASGVHTPETPAETPTLESSETWAELLAEPAPPKQSGGGISYSFVELALGEGDAGSFDTESFALSGSTEVNDAMFVTFGLSQTEADVFVSLFDPVTGIVVDDFGTLSADTMSLGFGGHFEPAQNVSVYGRFALGMQDAEVATFNFGTYGIYDADVTTLALGVRFRPNDQFEGFLELAESDADYDYFDGSTRSSDWSTRTLGGRYYTSNELAFILQISSADFGNGFDDQDLTAIGINYFF